MIGQKATVALESGSSIAVGAGENHIGSIGGNSVVAEITLTLDTSIYASGDVLADTQEVASAIRVNAGTGVIHSLIILDKDDQGQAMDVVFLKTNVSLGSENSPVSITDANADEILGIVEVAAGDYVDLVNSQLVTVTDVGVVVVADTGATSLWVGVISRGTGTYTASGITLKIGILQD